MKVKLTPRQEQIVKLACMDLKNDAIATELGIKPETVSWHMSKLYDEIGRVGRCGLTKWALRNGLTTL